jgi:hypothetical protein
MVICGCNISQFSPLTDTIASLLGLFVMTIPFEDKNVLRRDIVLNVVLRHQFDHCQFYLRLRLLRYSQQGVNVDSAGSAVRCYQSENLDCVFG